MEKTTAPGVDKERETVTFQQLVNSYLDICFIDEHYMSPEMIRSGLEKLEKYQVPEDDSEESLELQRIYGNIRATGMSRWEQKTGILWEERNTPLQPQSV